MLRHTAQHRINPVMHNVSEPQAISHDLKVTMGKNDQYKMLLTLAMKNSTDIVSGVFSTETEGIRNSVTRNKSKTQVRKTVNNELSNHVISYIIFLAFCLGHHRTNNDPLQAGCDTQAGFVHC